MGSGAKTFISNERNTINHQQIVEITYIKFHDLKFSLIIQHAAYLQVHGNLLHFFWDQ